MFKRTFLKLALAGIVVASPVLLSAVPPEVTMPREEKSALPRKDTSENKELKDGSKDPLAWRDRGYGYRGYRGYAYKYSPYGGGYYYSRPNYSYYYYSPNTYYWNNPNYYRYPGYRSSYFYPSYRSYPSAGFYIGF